MFTGNTRIYWKDIWLNEGFATYSEALYYESLTGKKALQSTMLSKFSKKFSGSLAEPGSFLFTRTVYDKGAWVLHMLRWEVGDSSFFKILRNYYEKYKYSNASTQDFKNVCENVSGKNLDKFFDQWINGEGQINLDYNKIIVQTDSGYSTKLNLEQVQDEYDVYHFPLQIKIIYADSSFQNYRFYITKKDTTLNISSDKYPVDVELDPDNWFTSSYT